MVYYRISLNPNQTRFIFDNYYALFILDDDLHKPPKMSLKRREELRKYYFSLNEDTKNYYRAEHGIVNFLSPALNKLLREVELNNNSDEFNKNSRSTPLIRSLYGIIGFERIMGGKRGYFHNYFIPSENLEATKHAIKNEGNFSKEFPDSDLEILDVIYKRNLELRRNLGINHRYPLFYISEISKRGGFDRPRTEKGLFNLIGILGFCLDNRMTHFERRWFVPRSREKLIETLLS